ncbi:hypothetical protein NPIL_58241 [Nephila pilipes]|uniref:Uncharacterized protein n=1 Tax=Nephila pilipes TaxID=299642 RepID=A0A8X6TKM8_NEPPI|nr:hypothetical protein NPIL_58241 [Nephila pilipes]
MLRREKGISTLIRRFHLVERFEWHNFSEVQQLVLSAFVFLLVRNDPPVIVLGHGTLSWKDQSSVRVEGEKLFLLSNTPSGGWGIGKMKKETGSNGLDCSRPSSASRGHSHPINTLLTSDSPKGAQVMKLFHLENPGTELIRVVFSEEIHSPNPLE